MVLEHVKFYVSQEDAHNRFKGAEMHRSRTNAQKKSTSKPRFTWKDGMHVLCINYITLLRPTSLTVSTVKHPYTVLSPPELPRCTLRKIPYVSISYRCL